MLMPRTRIGVSSQPNVTKLTTDEHRDANQSALRVAAEEQFAESRTQMAEYMRP